MIRASLLVLLVASATCTSWWVGVWNGIDTLDGGIYTLSITEDNARNYVLNMRFSDTFIRGCTERPDLLPVGWVGDGSPFSKRGIYLADVRDARDQLWQVDADDGNITVQVFCFANPGSTDEDLTPGDSPGVQLGASLVWTFDRSGDYIVMSGTLFTGENALTPTAGGQALGGDLTLRLQRTSNAETPKFVPWWVGVWRAVDPLDGGLYTLSISKDREDPDLLNMRFSDTFIRGCTNRPDLLPVGWIGDGPDYSKRGIYLANSRDNGDYLLAPGTGIREVPVQVFCFASSNSSDASLTPGDSPGVQLDANILWTFDRRGDYMIMNGTLFSGENPLVPADGGDTYGGDQTLRLHRISSNDGESPASTLTASLGLIVMSVLYLFAQ